ncbi:hypothetical protein [Phyllobacterium sp. K27]
MSRDKERISTRIFIVGGWLVDPARNYADIMLEDGKVVAVAAQTGREGPQLYEADGLIALPAASLRNPLIGTLAFGSNVDVTVLAPDERVFPFNNVECCQIQSGPRLRARDIFIAGRAEFNSA